MFERFTEAARNTVIGAREEARSLGHRHIGTEHLLLAMLSPQAGVAYQVLTEAGLDQGRVRGTVEDLVGKPTKILDDRDAQALKTIGIDLQAVLARMEESFGPGALETPAPVPRKERLWRGQTLGPGFSPRAKKAIELALREAIRLHNKSLGTEHLLLGLLREGNGLAAKVIHDAGLSLDDLRDATLQALGKAA